MGQANDEGYVFPSLLPALDAKLFEQYWSVSLAHGETVVGREAKCKNPVDSISRGLFWALQVRLSNEALHDHKDARCLCGRDVVLIRVAKSTTIHGPFHSFLCVSFF